MRPEAWTRPEYVAAFRELVARIAASLKDMPPRLLPAQMFVAGGAASKTRYRSDCPESTRKHSMFGCWHP
jgi:hypothetical protein